MMMQGQRAEGCTEEVLLQGLLELGVCTVSP